MTVDRITPVDVHTRRLRYFVTLAEELHFTRAAARLFIAQQTLSSQIRQLEEGVGAQLLRRTTRQVELTPAGEAFLTEARAALEALDRAVGAARATERRAATTISLGFMGSPALELTAPILSEFSRRFPQVSVELNEFGFADPSVGLAEQVVDIGFVRPPIEGPELRYEKLLAEPRVLCVGADHRFAGRESVTVQEVLTIEEPMIIPRCPDAAWIDFWTLAEYRDAPLTNVALHSGTLLLELEEIAIGKPCVMITALCVARFAPRPGVSYVRIADASPSVLTIGWRPERERNLVGAFVETAIEVRDRETDLVDLIEGRIAPAI